MRIGRTARALLLALMGIAAVAIVGCGASSPTQSKAATAGGGDSVVSGGSHLSVIMVVHGAPGDAFWNVVKHGAEDAAKDFGVDLTYSAPEKSDPVEQKRLLQAAIAKNPNGGIAVSISDADTLGPTIKQAISQGIPLVSFNSGQDDYAKLGIDAYFGEDNLLAGQEGGKRFAALGVKNAICINPAQGIKPVDDRCRGFASTMAAAGAKAKQVVVDGGDPTGAARTIQAALANDPTIDGVYTQGTIGFDPAYKALKDTGKLGKIKFATIDLSPAILTAVKNKEALFAVDQQPYLEGYLAVQSLAMRARTGMTPVGTVLTGPEFVTPANAQQAIELSKRGLR